MDIVQFLGSLAILLVTWFAGAIIVVGLMQTLKKLLPSLASNKAPTWLLTLIMVFVAIGVGIARFAMTTSKPEEGPIWVCLGIITFSQICYESIYRGIIKHGAKFVDGEAPATGAAQ